MKVHPFCRFSECLFACVAALFTICGLVATTAQSATVTTLHSFHGSDGSGPLQPMIRANDGNFYGCVPSGGNNGYGVIYKLTPAGQFTPFHVFKSDETEGSSPKVLIQGKDGNLYGITRGGGVSSGIAAGTFFKLTLSGNFTSLHTFDRSGNGPAFPSAIVQGSDGYFYGLSRDGGSNGLNDGTYFRITPNGQTVKELFAFKTGDGPGYRPEAQLIVGKDGNFYGVTNAGGATGGAGANGTIFRATKAGKVTRLHAFVGDEPHNNTYPLTQGPDGTLYGVSANGGQPDFGLVYKYNLGTKKLTILHTFQDPAIDGAHPFCKLVLGKDGNLYGAATEGFPKDPSSLNFGNGSYFKITPAGVYTTIAKTKGLNGGPAKPVGNLIETVKGVFYGLTIAGGTSGDGTLLKLVVPAPASLTSVSTRAQVLDGEDSLISNFTLAGNESAKVIVRGLGPSLPVDNSLAQPSLALHQSDGSVVQNEGWAADQAGVAETMMAPSDTREAAVVATLPAADSAYTTVLSSGNHGAGIGVLDISGLSHDGSSHLASVSTRGLIGGGEQEMIGSFTVGAGEADAKIAIRALGPSLAKAGIARALRNPTLKLYNSDGALIAANDDWAEAQGSDLTRVGLVPADSREASIVCTLAPGSYTAVVSGKGGAAGVGVIEIYNLP